MWRSGWMWALALAAGSAQAVDADPDAAFGGDGQRVVAFDLGAPNADDAVAVFEGTDGAGTWVIGQATPPDASGAQTDRVLAITRLAPDGSVIFKRTFDFGITFIATAVPAPGGGAVVLALGLPTGDRRATSSW